MDTFDLKIAARNARLSATSRDERVEVYSIHGMPAADLAERMAHYGYTGHVAEGTVKTTTGNVVPSIVFNCAA